jgi:DNA-binding PadR family transcriptional regulator
MILKYRETGVPITGIIAASMAGLDHERIRLLSEGIAKIIVSTGKDTMISFAHSTFPPESITVVPQATIEDVVKKLLEPVILSILEKPISGFDIVHEIHNRYKVLIPQARIYTYLYELQKNGYLEMKVSGKSKLYYPTESGKKYIRQRLIEFKFVFRHIMGEEPALPVKKE